MTLPGRTSSSTAYRYGFQGQEKDDELKGEGNSLNYTFRMHDPRVGRFFAVDPLTKDYPWYTPYSFSGNKVIHAVELEGLEEHEANFDRQTDHMLATRNIQYQKGDLKKGGKIMAVGSAVVLLVVADFYFTGGQVTQQTFRVFGFASSAYALGDLSAAMNTSEKAREARAKGDIEGAEILEKKVGELSKNVIFEAGGGIAGIGLGKIIKISKNVISASKSSDDIIRFTLESENGAINIGEAALNKGTLELDFSIPLESQGSGIGTDMFNFALKGFGNDVKQIQGLWLDGTNLDLFNKALKNGKKSSEAVFETATGKWAKANGYTELQWGAITDFNNNGAANRVEVFFSKPKVE